MEFAIDGRCSRVGLASADADGVIPLSDDWMPILSHDSQVARLQIEMDFLARARLKMDALKSA
jgi:hypothetical protein